MSDEKQLTKLLPALAKAQSEFPEIKKDKEGQEGHRTYMYADLNSILKAVIPVLTKHGLCIVQIQEHTSVLIRQKNQINADKIESFEYESKFVLRTRIYHSSGEFIESIYPLPDAMTKKPKEFGSLVTYARRYSLTPLIGIEADQDDDGTAAQEEMKKQQQQNQRPAQRPQQRPQQQQPRQAQRPPQSRQPAPQPQQQPRPKNHAPGASNDEGEITQKMKRDLWKEMVLKKITEEEGKQLIDHMFQAQSTDQLTRTEYDYLLECVKLKGRKLIVEAAQEYVTGGPLDQLEGDS